MVGLKGDFYLAKTTLILYQARVGKGRVGRSALPSNKKLGLPSQKSYAEQASMALHERVHPWGQYKPPLWSPQV